MATTIYSGVLAGGGPGTAFPVQPGAQVVLCVNGAGSAAIERSPDAGTTWYPVAGDAFGTPAVIATPGGCVMLTEVEYQCMWRVNATGAVNWRATDTGNPAR